MKGKFQQMFEEEYARIVNEYITLFEHSLRPLPAALRAVGDS